MGTDERESAAIVRTAAATLDFLDDDGHLVDALDSFSALSLISEIEHMSGITFPTESLDLADFSSLDAVARKLDALRGARGT